METTTKTTTKTWQKKWTHPSGDGRRGPMGNPAAASRRRRATRQLADAERVNVAEPKSPAFFMHSIRDESQHNRVRLERVRGPR